MNLLILVVDDEPDVEMLFRQHFRRDLRERRFDMEFAQSGDMALQRITDPTGESLILVLSDINMPGMTGLELLPKAKAARPDVPVIMITAYGDAETKRAIAGVAELIRLRESKTLERAQRLYGDRAATTVTVPSRILEEGMQEIDGVVYDFKKFEDGESEAQLTALLPRHKLLMAFDLVFSSTVHAFTVAPFFDHWIGILRSLKAMEGYETVMVGHYWPVDRSAIDSTIAYLSRAKEVHSTSPDAKTYSERIKATFPERQQQGWVDYSTDFLYGPARPR
jgi:CheY-like chemotaxis protein